MPNVRQTKSDQSNISDVGNKKKKMKKQKTVRKKMSRWHRTCSSIVWHGKVIGIICLLRMKNLKIYVEHEQPWLYIMTLIHANKTFKIVAFWWRMRYLWHIYIQCSFKKKKGKRTNETQIDGLPDICIQFFIFFFHLNIYYLYGAQTSNRAHDMHTKWNMKIKSKTQCIECRAMRHGTRNALDFQLQVYRL